MKTHRLFQMLMTLILFACALGVQGQYGMPAGGNSITEPSIQSNEQNSQYYTMQTGPIPSTHISAPAKIDIIGMVPANLYLGTQNQEVPYSQYISNPANAEINSLWVQGLTDWTQSITVPQGASVMLIATSKTGGSGYLNEIHPDGRTSSSNLYFYPGSSRMNFYADAIGRHILSFVINGKVSNTVIIDVTGVYTTPSNYLPPTYYPGYYGYYPGFSNFGIGSETGISSGDTGGRISGGDTGGDAGGDTGGDAGGPISGGDTGDRASGGDTGGRTSGGENGGK